MKFDIDKLGLNRKLNKLKNNPELFVKDMVFKRTAQVKKYIPVKYEGKNNFTIVSAVYNVSSYLDEYFESIVKQSLNFKKHIFIVCVDDGSTDHSAEIIQKWQRKYPNNIQYIYKENGGQASARNLGLNYVDTEWVTFTDPDDYLHPDYFKEIDLAIQANKKAHILAANLHFYMENEGITKDTHPLRKKFHEKTTLLDIKKIGLQLQLHASSTIFKIAEIKKHQIIFDETIKPSFEDGKFLTDYLMYAPEHAQIKFVKSSVYLYRKRESGDSTLDGAWDKVGQYTDVLANGVLPMFEGYQAKHGFVPESIQNIGLYHISWYLKRLINNQHKIDFLTDEQKSLFRELTHKCFDFINEETILKFNLSDIWFFHKVGLLGLFKNSEPKFQIAYVESVDFEKQQILVNYFYYQDHVVSFKLGEQDVIPAFDKNVMYSFNEETFVKEKRVWLPYEDEAQLFKIKQNATDVRITVKGKQYLNGVQLKDILAKFKPSPKYIADGSWLLMDRNTQADDNAEHLYRYVKNNHPEQKIVFAVEKSSSDWDRLFAEGFNLVDFGSIEFELALRKASKIISSHLDQYVFNYFGDHYEFSKKFIFLQHGVTKDNLSTWFNTKKGLNTLITSTKPEYESIAKNNNTYKLTEKEVILTGFPRHDELLNGNLTNTKKILVMPTWRDNVVGKIIGKNGERQLNSQFLETEYAQHWGEFLRSERLKELVTQYGYEVVFFPHNLIKPYVSLLQIPEYITVLCDDVSIQDLFKQSEFLITDYSSVAFEFGFLNKTVLYYQFDKEAVFSGAHTYSKGYFDYEEHGFGPVVENNELLDAELENILENNGFPQSLYLERMENTYPFRDGKNSERVYQHLLDLDVLEENTVSEDILRAYIHDAESANDIQLLKLRYEMWLKEFPNIDTDNIKSKLGHLLRQTQNWTELSQLLGDSYQLDWDVEIKFAHKEWVNLVDTLEMQDGLNDNHKLLLLYVYLQQGEHDLFLDKYTQVIDRLDSDYQAVAQVFFGIIEQDWNYVLENIETVKNSENEISLGLFDKYQLSVFEATALRKNGDFDKSRHLIHKVKNSENDTFFLLEKAKVHFGDEKYKEALYFFNKLYAQEELDFFKLSTLEEYTSALVNQKQWNRLADLLPLWLQVHSDSLIFQQSYLVTLQNLKKWVEIFEFSKNIQNQDLYKSFIYPIVLAHYRIGLIEEAYGLMIVPTYEHSYEYWMLVIELCLQMKNSEEAAVYLRKIMAIFPEKSENAHEKYTKLNNFLGQLV